MTIDDWKPLAEQGFAQSQTNLGLMYGKDQGVKQNYKEAVKWYQVAAEQGLAQAQHNLGVMYGRGQGVAKDYQEAAKGVDLKIFFIYSIYSLKNTPVKPLSIEVIWFHKRRFLCVDASENFSVV